MTNYYHFCHSFFGRREIQVVKLILLAFQGPSGWRQKRHNFPNSSLLPPMWEKNEIYMYGYDELEALYQKCEIDSPLVRGPVPRVGPIWPYSEDILNVSQSFLLSHV